MDVDLQKLKLGRFMIVALFFIFILQVVLLEFIPVTPMTSEAISSSDGNLKSLYLLWESTTINAINVDLRPLTLIQVLVIFVSTLGAIHQFIRQMPELLKYSKERKLASDVPELGALPPQSESKGEAKETVESTASASQTREGAGGS